MIAYLTRALAITDRVMPPADRVPHGFYEPEGFIAAAAYEGRRSILTHILAARLRSKAEGGVAQIKMPHDSHALRGSAMEKASRLLAWHNEGTIA